MVFIWIVADSMRCDYLDYRKFGCKNIEQLNRDSLNYTNAYTQASFTSYSFSSFLTGLYPWDLHKRMRNENKFDKWGENSIYSFPNNVKTIFDLCSISGFKCYSYTQPILGKNYNYDGWGLYKNWKQFSSHPIEPYCEPIIEQLRKSISDDQNVLVFIRSSDTHIPWVCLEEMQKDGLQGRSWKDITIFLTNLLDDNKYELLEKYILKGLLRFDSQLLSPIISLLKKTKSYDESAIILHSDHGDLLWDRNTYQNNQVVGHNDYLWQSVVKVPLLVKLPGFLKYSGAYDGIFELRDLFFLASKIITSFSSNGGVIPVNPVLNENFIFPRREVTCGMNINNKYYCTDGNWKLHYDSFNQNAELYNLKLDINELNNVALENPHRVKYYKEILKIKIDESNYLETPDLDINSLLQQLGYLD